MALFNDIVSRFDKALVYTLLILALSRGMRFSEMLGLTRKTSILSIVQLLSKRLEAI